MRKIYLGTLLVAFVLLIYVEPSHADNCGSLSDCFKQSKTAAIAVAMTALLASLLLDFSPIGYAKGLLEAVIGKDILTGDKLAWWQRVLNLVPGGKGARTAANAVDEIGDIAKAVDKVTDAAKVGEELGDTAKDVDKWVDEVGNIRWPSQDKYPRGFVDGTIVKETLPKGTKIDRYGTRDGTFVAPEGTPYSNRSLPPGSYNKPYERYEVIKPIEVDSGKTAPWFGEKGGGTQYDLPKTIEELLDDDSIRFIGKK
jgi:hypothetical protein